jgi:hypothetical protein
MIPYPETMMEPNRSNFLALGAIVGMGKIRGPEKWPEWDRLVDRFGWRIVLRAADRCEPINRWSANVETICQQLAKDEAEASAPRPAPPPVPRDRHAAASLFEQMRRKHGV